QMIHRNIEKALNLLGVQIDRQHAVGTGGGDEIGHELGGDGRAALVFAILSCVAEVWNHRRDTPRRRSLETVDEDEQFHQVGVDRMVGGLHDEAVAAAHV